MVDEDIVQRQARYISQDADIPDAESEVLRDLLKSDEVFGALITAQQNAVMVNTDDHDITDRVQNYAGRAASAAGTAIDAVLEDRKAQAQMIVAISDQLDVPWGAAWSAFQAGYRSVDDIEAASQEDLVDDGVPEVSAARMKVAAEQLEVEN